MRAFAQIFIYVAIKDFGAVIFNWIMMARQVAALRCNTLRCHVATSALRSSHLRWHVGGALVHLETGATRSVAC
jgi:hypothetical protein